MLYEVITSLWLTDNLGGMRMFELDPATCETLSSFPVGGSSYAGGLAWDGTYFYHGRITSYNVCYTKLLRDTAWNSDLTMTHRFAGGDTFAVTVKIANGDATHEAATNFVVDNRHGHELSAVHIDGTGPNCMAFDGTYMWRTDWAYA